MLQPHEGTVAPATPGARGFNLRGARTDHLVHQLRAVEEAIRATPLSLRDSSPETALNPALIDLIVRELEILREMKWRQRVATARHSEDAVASLGPARARPGTPDGDPDGVNRAEWPLLGTIAAEWNEISTRRGHDG